MIICLPQNTKNDITNVCEALCFLSENKVVFSTENRIRLNGLGAHRTTSHYIRITIDKISEDVILLFKLTYGGDIHYGRERI